MSAQIAAYRDAIEIARDVAAQYGSLPSFGIASVISRLEERIRELMERGITR